MSGFFLYISSIFLLFLPGHLCGMGRPEHVSSIPRYNGSDTASHTQILYNGRIWRNMYSQVEEDQFLFSKDFLDGTVTMRGMTFPGIKIRYDIFTDEILTPYKPFGIIQINKEMVDSFSIFFNDTKYFFERISGSDNENSGKYLNRLYNGKTKLYVRYEKKIEKLADGGRYDKFYQVNRVFIYRAGVFSTITGKKDIIRLSGNYKKGLRNYLKTNKMRINRYDITSYIPVLMYIDSITDPETRE